MKEEFRQSLDISEEIMQNKATWEKLFEPPNFFAKYRHFIVLEVSSSTEEDQLEWYGLVESKVRHLILNLERESIELAHVWPKTYPSLEEGREKTCCYWFVGLVIKAKQTTEEGQPQNLDLTTPIKAFTELVMRSAINITVWKEGMKVEAFYRKRKQLSQYLPPSERHKLKVERPRPSASALAAANSALNSPSRTVIDRSNENSLLESPNTTNQGTPLTTTTTMTAGKRRPSDLESDVDMSLSGDSSMSNAVCNNPNMNNSEVTNGSEQSQPPMKRSNTANETPMNGNNGLEVSS